MSRQNCAETLTFVHINANTECDNQTSNVEILPDWPRTHSHLIGVRQLAQVLSVWRVCIVENMWACIVLYTVNDHQLWFTHAIIYIKLTCHKNTTLIYMHEIIFTSWLSIDFGLHETKMLCQNVRLAAKAADVLLWLSTGRNYFSCSHFWHICLTCIACGEHIGRSATTMRIFYNL